MRLSTAEVRLSPLTCWEELSEEGVSVADLLDCRDVLGETDPVVDAE